MLLCGTPPPLPPHPVSGLGTSFRILEKAHRHPHSRGRLLQEIANILGTLPLLVANSSNSLFETPHPWAAFMHFFQENLHPCTVLFWKAPTSTSVFLWLGVEGWREGVCGFACMPAFNGWVGRTAFCVVQGSLITVFPLLLYMVVPPRVCSWYVMIALLHLMAPTFLGDKLLGISVGVFFRR